MVENTPNAPNWGMKIFFGASVTCQQNINLKKGSPSAVVPFCVLFRTTKNRKNILLQWKMISFQWKYTNKCILCSPRL